MDFKNIRILDEKPIKEGERWVYSAGFNVKPDLKNKERINAEIEGIKYILKSKGVVSILSHQGRTVDKDMMHLDFLTLILNEKLGTPVRYFPENNSEAAVNFSKSLKSGEVAIFGNTRFHKGEEENDSNLAKQFAKLGDYVAIGGFSKAHRKNASNIGILEYLPGYITKNQLEEMKFLSQWSGKKPDVYSVAILGGVKKEKITIGLKSFSKIYDFIIPGGIVLNTILKTKGYKIGCSLIKDGDKSFEEEVSQILKETNEFKIYIPSKVIIAKKVDNGFEDSKTINISEGIPNDYMIVDYVLDSTALEALEKTKNNGRIILTGTPTLYTGGFDCAMNQILPYLENPNVKSIVLGGDSASEIPSKGLKSSGGGAALQVICEGKTAVCEALKKNKEKFN